MRRAASTDTPPERSVRRRIEGSQELPGSQESPGSQTLYFTMGGEAFYASSNDEAEKRLLSGREYPEGLKVHFFEEADGRVMVVLLYRSVPWSLKFVDDSLREVSGEATVSYEDFSKVEGVSAGDLFRTAASRAVLVDVKAAIERSIKGVHGLALGLWDCPHGVGGFMCSSFIDTFRHHVTRRTGQSLYLRAYGTVDGVYDLVAYGETNLPK